MEETSLQSICENKDSCGQYDPVQGISFEIPVTRIPVAEGKNKAGHRA